MQNTFISVLLYEFGCSKRSSIINESLQHFSRSSEHLSEHWNRNLRNSHLVIKAKNDNSHYSVLISGSILKYFNGKGNLPRAAWNGVEWGFTSVPRAQLCCPAVPAASCEIPAPTREVGPAQNKSWQPLTQQETWTAPLKSHLRTGGITDGTLMFTCTCFKLKYPPHTDTGGRISPTAPFFLCF